MPEFPGSGRCWDYRFCWLRDAYFSLNAFERLGHFDEMERFLFYLRTILETQGDHLQPLYSVTPLFSIMLLYRVSPLYGIT